MDNIPSIIIIWELLEKILRPVDFCVCFSISNHVSVLWWFRIFFSKRLALRSASLTSGLLLIKSFPVFVSSSWSCYSATATFCIYCLVRPSPVVPTLAAIDESAVLSVCPRAVIRRIRIVLMPPYAPQHGQITTEPCIRVTYRLKPSRRGTLYNSTANSLTDNNVDGSNGAWNAVIAIFIRPEHNM